MDEAKDMIFDEDQLAITGADITYRPRNIQLKVLSESSSETIFNVLIKDSAED